MPETVHRTLTMRTAVSLTQFGAAQGGPGSLSALLDAIHGVCRTVPRRRATVAGQIIEGRNVRRGRDGSTLLHIIAYTPDDPLSVVPQVGNVAAADLELLEAPPDTEFLDGQLMLLVKDNDVVMCRSGLGEAAFVSYVVQLAARRRIDAQHASFHLMKRADIDKLELIRRDGVKAISMNAVARQASVDHVERTSVRKRILGDVWDEISAILGIEREVPPDAENVMVEVLLSFNKRQGTELDQRQLAAIAEMVLEEEEQEEGFMIETLAGRKLRAQDIVLSKPVRLPAVGKSVRHVDAWGALREFYTELTAPMQE